jgi:hypothetical protein
MDKSDSWDLAWFSAALVSLSVLMAVVTLGVGQ